MFRQIKTAFRSAVKDLVAFMPGSITAQAPCFTESYQDVLLSHRNE
ncbi:MAG: hypothetical protein AABW49_02660 [Nanoarchaeota archaeon]